MLKHEVMLRFGGDANILLSSMVARLPKYIQYEERQAAATRTTISAPKLSSLQWDLIKKIAKDYPQMQIAVQVDADKWDAKKFTPSVVYQESDYNEDKTKVVKGFDPKGAAITVDATKDPNVNYVVISQNERTTMNADVSLVYSNTPCQVSAAVNSAPYDPAISMYDPIDPCNPGDGGGWTPPPPPPAHPQYNGTGFDGVLPSLLKTDPIAVTNVGGRTVSQPKEVNSGTGVNRRTLTVLGQINGRDYYRPNASTESLTWIKFNRLNEIEGWINGAPEGRVTVLLPDAFTPAVLNTLLMDKFEPRRRQDIENWWEAVSLTGTRPIRMNNWNFTQTGTSMVLHLWEYDPDNTGLKIVVSGLKITSAILKFAGVISAGVSFAVSLVLDVAAVALIVANEKSEDITNTGISIFESKTSNTNPMNKGGCEFSFWPQ